MAIGVLLVNVGTPDTTDIPDIQRYLLQFMSDRRVIDKSGIIWKLLLRYVIIPKRAPVVAKAYQAIWNKDLNESPLRTITREQALGVQNSLSGIGEVQVEWAMRYGSPSVDQGLCALVEKGCDRILIAPLYPQYSGATTGTVVDEVGKSISEMQAPPTLRMLPPYFDDPTHLETLSTQISSHLSKLDWSPEVLLLSFHGLPQAFIDRGEPYLDHCKATAAGLCNSLSEQFGDIRLVFQSRSRRLVWTGPELEDTLEEMAKEGIRNITVATPGFAADCLETIEEVGLRAAEHFRAHGGEKFSHVPCLNSSPEAVQMLSLLVKNELSGWL